jgi:cytoskeletal protein RodZ
VNSWFKARLGQFRVSTIVLIIVFIALFWVQQTFQPVPAPQEPAPAVVPPGFVPDPNYTWVPRTNVSVPKESESTTTTTTTPTTTETTTPSVETTTSPTSPTPTTTVIDPDGPGGPLPPQTFTQTPGSTTPTTGAPIPGTVPASPGAPR